MDVTEFRGREQGLAVGHQGPRLGLSGSVGPLGRRSRDIGPERMNRGNVPGTWSTTQRHLERLAPPILRAIRQGGHALGKRARQRHDVGMIEEEQALRRDVGGVAAAADERGIGEIEDGEEFGQLVAHDRQVDRPAEGRLLALALFTRRFGAWRSAATSRAIP